MNAPYYQPAPPPTNNNGTAIAVEAVLALFGVYGVGWLMAGKKGVGIPLMIGGFIWDICVIIIAFVTLGTGFCCLVPLHFLFVGLSTILLTTQIHSSSDNRTNVNTPNMMGNQSWQPGMMQNNMPPAFHSMPQAGSTQYSPDGRYWWDGQTWQPVAPPQSSAAAGSTQYSPDGQYWWDGQTWQPVRQIPDR